MNHLTTAITGKKVSSWEVAADFCLKPVHYVWEGRKVEIIQCDEALAGLVDRTYSDSEYTLLRTVAMVILLIPGFFVGGILKAIAVQFFHTQSNDFFIENMQKGWEKISELEKPHKVFGTSLELINQVKILQKMLRIVMSLDQNRPVFLSEIERLALMIELPKLEKEFVTPQIKPAQSLGKRANATILAHVDLLWNLQHIDLADHMCSPLERKKLEANNSLLVTEATSRVVFKDERWQPVKKFFQDNLKYAHEPRLPLTPI